MKQATARSYRDLSEEQERRAQKLQRSSLVIDAIGSSIVSPEPPIKEGKSYVDRALKGQGQRPERDAGGARRRSSTASSIRPPTTSTSSTRGPRPRCWSRRSPTSRRRSTRASSGSSSASRPAASSAPTCTLDDRAQDRLPDGAAHVQRTEPARRRLPRTGEPGLTSYGRQSIQEMNRLGICLDLARRRADIA